MASDVTLAGATNNMNKTYNAGIKLADDFTQFLTLLTTQLQNQDPLDPMDSTEFTSQLVQFSQVEQSINTNQKLDDLVSLQLASISSVALGYVGLDVMYRSSEMDFNGTDPVKIVYGLGDAAQSVTINVYDEEGNLVFTDSGPKSVGSNEYIWSGAHKGGGLVEKGTYTVSVDALDSKGKVIETSTVVSGRVRGIETQNGIVYTLIGERAVALGNIINATIPASTATPPPADTGTDPGGSDPDPDPDAEASA